jgi:hypothetical protein
MQYLRVLPFIMNFLQYGLCYTFNSGKNDHGILKATRTGSTFGLSMVINIQPEEYYGQYSREGTGFRVIIHDQEVYPLMEKSSWQISPGSSVEMQITRNEVNCCPYYYYFNNLLFMVACLNEQLQQ